MFSHDETAGIDMKGRESGMPDEAYWASFFNPDLAVDLLLPSDARNGDIVEFGCGYATFTLPVARRTKGYVNALDIEPEMLELMRQKADAEGLKNIRGFHRDFLAGGTGLSDGSQRHAMIYNLLHIEHPVDLLREAHRVLDERGSLSVMHWRSDIPTPRGPPSTIRPTSKQCLAWMDEAGFRQIEVVNLDRCCPHHFGLLGRV